MKQTVALGFAAALSAFVACRNEGNSDAAKEENAQNAPASDSQLQVQEVSISHFQEAEAQAAAGHPEAAARHLHRAIVIYRRETGPVHGRPAAHINHTIGTLTRLRSRLHRGEAVSPEELHRAVSQALGSRPNATPPVHPTPDPGLFVPVGGN